MWFRSSAGKTTFCSFQLLICIQNISVKGGGRWLVCGCVSKSSWGTRTCWQRAACWSQFPEAQCCLGGCSQPTPRCPEAQQPMPALDFWRTSLSSVTAGLHPPHQPLTSPLLAIAPPVLAPPTTRALQRCGRQFASSRVRQKKGCVTCLWWFLGKVVPLSERGEGAPGRSCLVQKSFLVPTSRQPVDRWDVQACYIVECERNSAGDKTPPPHSDILDFSCHTNLEFTPQWRFFKYNRKYNAKNSNAYRCFTALLKRVGDKESRCWEAVPSIFYAPPVLFSTFLLKLRFWNMISDPENFEYVKKTKVICWNQSRKHAYSRSSAGVLTRACAITFFHAAAGRDYFIAWHWIIIIIIISVLTLTTLSLIVCFTLKWWCMAAVVNVENSSHRMWEGQYLPKFENLQPYWGTAWIRLLWQNHRDLQWKFSSFLFFLDQN